MKETRKPPTQILANIGLYYVCYELSKRGWNVLPTSRNAKGIDLVIYCQSAKRTKTIQVKSLRKRVAVPVGNPDNLIAEYLFVCRGILENVPSVFIAKVDEVKPKIDKDSKGNFWLEPRNYEGFKDRWNVIGVGDSED